MQHLRDVLSDLLLRMDHAIGADLAEDLVMGAADGFDPDGVHAEPLRVHRAQNIGLEVLADRHHRDVVPADAGLAQRLLVASVRNHGLGKHVGHRADVTVVLVDPEHVVAEARKLRGDRAAERAET